MRNLCAIAIAVLFNGVLLAQDVTEYYVPNPHFPDTYGGEHHVLITSMRNTLDEPLVVAVTQGEHCQDLELEDSGLTFEIEAGDKLDSRRESTDGDAPAWTKVSHPPVDGGKRLLKISQFWRHVDKWGRTISSAPVTLHHEVFAECPEPKTFHGLRIEPENRCSPYDPEDYSYPASIKDQVAKQQGGAFCPYDYQCFASTDEMSLDHMVSRAEAHDSGLCRASAEAKKQFASDLSNLTLIPKEFNPYWESEKLDKDAAEWVPGTNECWFAGTVIEVKRKYRLSVDQAEADALEEVLAGCAASEIGRMHGPD